MTSTDALWGGTLTQCSFDPVAWTLSFGVEVLDSGSTSRYDLVLIGVSEWSASRVVPLPWNYAELTQVHVSEVGDAFSVELVLWSDGTSVSVRCTEVRVERKPS